MNLALQGGPGVIFPRSDNRSVNPLDSPRHQKGSRAHEAPFSLAEACPLRRLHGGAHWPQLLLPPEPRPCVAGSELGPHPDATGLGRHRHCHPPQRRRHQSVWDLCPRDHRPQLTLHRSSPGPAPLRHRHDDHDPHQSRLPRGADPAESQGGDNGLHGRPHGHPLCRLCSADRPAGDRVSPAVPGSHHSVVC